jgi:hypothetical protein
MTNDLKKERADKSMAKRRAIKELEQELERLDLFQKAEWSIMQDLALDVEAYYSASNKKLTAEMLIEELKKEAKNRYAQYEGLPEKIAAAAPSVQAVATWRQRKEWKPAIWDRCKETGLFTKERKSMVIEKMFEKIMEKGDVQAAKMWLMMAGEYVEKQEVKGDKDIDIFREINQTLRKK